ncbi:MAG: hypothetical protein HZC54_07230 [Verrucomicrobia bacterium]|nr:hypothetical protein [Verrucomicrobiota bacterium]
MRLMIRLLAGVFLSATAFAKEAPPPAAELVVREVRYDAALAEKETRFVVELDAEASGRGEACATLFGGDVAVLSPKLPANLRLARAGNQYRLIAAKAGRFKLKLDLVAKITRAEPWNQVSFTGPVAAIASIAAQAAGDGIELQLLSGTATEPQAKGGPAKVRGLIGADRVVSLRWQSKAAEAARKALVTCETTGVAHITPAVVKFTTRFNYEIVQGNIPKLTVTLPAAQAITRLQGDQIRDWQIKTEGDRQLLTVEPLKPLEKNYTLTLYSEQPVEAATAQLAPPQPQEVARESGTLTLSAEDMLVETDATTGLRQVNAPDDALAAYQFYGRPATLALKLRRIEPVITTAAHITARLEETRLLVSHAITLTVEKAGIYSLELAPLGSFLVADVRGGGIEDWKAAGGKLTVNFSGRVLGTRTLDVQLELAQKNVPEQIAFVPLRVAGAAKETSQLAAATAPGFRLKTAKAAGLREVPVGSLRESDFKPMIPSPSSAMSREKEEMERKLNSIRLPKLEFRDTSIVEVINYLNKQSRAIDEQQSGGEGVNIVLAGLPFTEAKAGSKTDSMAGTPGITLNLMDVPLRDALRYVTDIAGLKFVVDKYAVLVTPVTYQPPGVMQTRDFQVPTGVFTTVFAGASPRATPSGGTEVSSEDIKKFFTDAGVKFDMGASVTYQAATGRLFVTNTSESLDTIENILNTLQGEKVMRHFHSTLVLAYTADQPDWQLSLGVERLSPRLLVDIFNLVTIGDGLVGGSATVRYAIFNQGVQELRLRLPSRWKNVEFTGPGIRRKDQQKDDQGEVWTIALQEKAWGSYTLVITYDEQFDPHKATLVAGGIHTLDVERETGSVAITAAASLQLREKSATGPLRRVDEAELAENDRALISRPVLLAYRYPTGEPYDLAVEVVRHELLGVLDAVADRTQLTTVLTDSGQMLTQASFMVKNNDKQFQRFTLPHGAEFWSCYVANQPVKAERDGDVLLAPLPRGANRDQAFAVDIVYAQNLAGKKPAPKAAAAAPDGGAGLKSWWPSAVKLEAPKTDVQTTYAEWELYVPATHTLASFGGNMTVARGTTYGLHDAWEKFVKFYQELFDEGAAAVAVFAVLFVVFILIVAAVRRGWKGALAVFSVIFVLGLLFTVMLPSLAGSKRRTATFDNIQSQMTSQGIATTEPTATSASKSSPGWEELKYKKPKPMFVGTPKNLRSPNLEPPGGAPVTTAPEPPAEAPAAAAADEAGIAGASAAGIRPIRVDIPRTGERFVFTKVLNIGGEALSAQAWAVKSEVRNAARAALELAAFLLGVWIIRREMRRARPRSLRLAAGLALCLGAVGSALIALRLLHIAFILVGPALAIVVMVWVAKKLLPPQPPKLTPPPSPPPSAGPAAPAVTALLALALLLPGANAAEMQQQRAQVLQHSIASTLHPTIPPSAGVAITSATYTGAARGKVAQFEAAFELQVSEAGRRVTLFGDDVAVQEFSASLKDAKLVRDGAMLAAWLPKRGAATVRVKLVVKTAGDETSRKLAFAIPPALTGKLSALLDETDATVEAPTAVSFKTTAEQQQTRVEAVLGAATRVELSWTPQTKRAAEVAATVFCQNTTLASFGGGVLNTRATLSFQVAQGELRQARVRLPRGQRLLKVEGELIRTWDVATAAKQEDGGVQILTVELMRGISSTNWPLTVVTEKVLTKLPVSERVEAPRALEAKRETGWIALAGSEELNVTVEKNGELQRVDAEEFLKAERRRPMPGDEFARLSKLAKSEHTKGAAAPAIVAAYRFQKPVFDLTARVEAVQPQIEATVQNQFRITAEQLAVTSQVDYTIKKAGVFALRLALPAGLRVESVAGENISQWTERTEGGQRLLEVALKERALGAYSLRMALVRLWKELPKSVEIAGAHPLGTQKLSGTVSASAEPGIQLKCESLEGLTETPAATASNDSSAGATLAYKFIATEPAARAPWTLTVATEAVEAWVRAEVVNWVTMTETLIAGRSRVRYDIQNAPVKELRVRVPAAFKNVELHGADIRRRDQKDGEWRIELQNKTRGIYTLTVAWELPWKVEQGALELAGVEAAGVERENGALAVIARPPLQVDGQAAGGDLLRVDAGELPEWAGRAPEATVLAYRYLRPGWKLKLATKRFAEAEVLQALVDSARLVTEVAEDGQTMTMMWLEVRNNGRQFLRVTLPPGARVWSAFVAGQAVRPGKGEREGTVQLPLERAASGDEAVRVELTYVSAEKFPATRGRFELVSPALDVPLKNARWSLYLPPDYSYSGFEGTMTHEEVAAPLVQIFSLSEYQRAENEQAQARQEEVSLFLSSARSNLFQGKAKVAVDAYNRARASGGKGKFFYDNVKDFKDIEQQVRQSQAANIGFNNALVGQSGTAGGAQLDVSQATMSQQPARVDADAAAKQYDKLQQAQEMAVARVSPLRVNLPTHGVKHVFTQVLQTDLARPMTIRFDALNTRAIGWPVKAGLGVVAFGLLWLATVLTLRRRV